MDKALARAIRQRKVLDTSVHATLEDLARAKGVAPSYASRVLRLTLLAPDIIEAILDGRQPVELQLDDLLEGFPLSWEEHSALARCRQAVTSARDPMDGKMGEATGSRAA